VGGVPNPRAPETATNEARQFALGDVDFEESIFEFSKHLPSLKFDSGHLAQRDHGPDQKMGNARFDQKLARSV
jgi:hypothetical protein